MQPYERIIDADADGTHGVELVSSASLAPSDASDREAPADIAAAPDMASLLITLVFLDTPSVLCHAQAAWTPADLCSHLECLQQYTAAGRTIRFVFQGAPLLETISLSDAGIANGSHIHVAVSAEAPPNDHAVAVDDEQAHIPVYLRQLLSDNPDEFGEGTPPQLLCGFLLGAFIGPIMVIWLWQNMPRRQKLGLALGILCNIIYNVVRVSMADKQAAIPTVPPTPSPSHIIYYALSWSPAFR